jgi:hypothetical protein
VIEEMTKRCLVGDWHKGRLGLKTTEGISNRLTLTKEINNGEGRGRKEKAQRNELKSRNYECWKDEDSGEEGVGCRWFHLTESARLTSAPLSRRSDATSA